MDIKITLDKTVPIDLTGGEYATAIVEIFVNSRLPIRTQRINIIHSVIENFLRMLPHDKIDELTDLIQNALDEWEEKRKR